MAEVDGNPQAEAAAPVVDSPEAVVGSAPTVEGRWKLPEGIEDHIESGIINCAMGGIAGGLLGLVAFRSGGGWRGACAAVGVGVGLGSTLERAKFMPKSK